MKVYGKIIFVFFLVMIFTISISCVSKKADDAPHVILSVPFTGSSFDYEYNMPEGRDRNWEKNVIFLAHLCLNTSSGHPLLTDKESMTLTENSIMGGLDAIREVSYYDENLRELFMNNVNDLISQIPFLEDYEIAYGMKEIIALLGDLHSNLLIPIGEFFPFYFVPFYDDEGISLYNMRVPKEEKALKCRLFAINDISIDEIMKRMKKLDPYENEYVFVRNMLDVREGGLLYRKEVLQYIGVIDKEKDTAVFTFLDAKSKKFTVELKAVSMEEYQSMDLVRHEINQEAFFMYSRTNENYWYKYLPEDNMMYVRYSKCIEMKDLSYKEFITDLTIELKKISGVKRYVIDLRDNPGGYPSSFIPNLINLFNQNRELIDTVYILIDEGTMSMGVVTASLIKKHVENAILIGRPAGQKPDFFMANLNSQLPFFNIEISLSSNYISTWPEYEGDVLMPDIFVNQTLEDYLNNIDTVLEAIKGY